MPDQSSKTARISNERHLIPIIERLDSALVGCVGDIMLDHFIYGDVTRISPEAPVPVLRVTSQTSMLGGLGNVVRNLGALGTGAAIFSVTGADDAGSEIETLLSKLQYCDTHIVRESGRSTPVKVRYVAGSQQLLRADQETVNPISESSLQSLLDKFEASIAPCSVVVLSDYLKGILVGSLASQFIQAARAQGKIVIVDPKGSDFSRYRYATIIKPNLKELAEATGYSVDGIEFQINAARKLISQTDAEYILVTRSAEGMLLVPRHGEILQLPSLAREVFDVSGAGDTVAATFAAALAVGASIADAVGIANIAAGIVVAKTGTAVVDRSEIISEIEHRSAAIGSDKVLTMAKAIERTKMWHRLGLKVSLAFGPFEYLSPAELHQLEKLKNGCDRLIVAVGGDLSPVARRFSTPSDQHSRARLLTSVVISDAVIVCDDLSAEPLVSLLQPDAFLTLETQVPTERSSGQVWESALQQNKIAQM